jgi:hypothetical protein
MIHIVSTHVSKRMHFVLSFVFGEVLKTGYSLLSENEVGTQPVLRYGITAQQALPAMPDTGLLWQQGAPATLPQVEVQDDLPVLFKPVNAGTEDDFPFDLFSMVFYCLARCEEYQITQRDAHGRFESTSSIFQQWHTQPYLDIWIRRFASWLIGQGLLDGLPKPTSKWINTMDIDIAYAYRGRGAVRGAGAFVRDTLRLNISLMVERLNVLALLRPDPFDTYRMWLDAGIGADETLCFILIARRKGLDINLDPEHPAMIALMDSLGPHAELGIHPSYASLDSNAVLQYELSKWKQLRGPAPAISRQHYLRMQLPNTYRQLAQAGVQREYSLGFADAVGFRAGTAHPFSFFDLEQDEILGIKLYTLVAMDSAMMQYMKLKPAEALVELQKLWEAVQRSGGNFVTVWHNHSLSNRDEWRGWQQVYLTFANGVQQTR